jgi:hypothetical protein
MGGAEDGGAASTGRNPSAGGNPSTGGNSSAGDANDTGGSASPGGATNGGSAGEAPACGVEAGAPPCGSDGRVAFADLVTDYTELTRVTEEPIQFVDYGLCRLPIRGFDTPAHTGYGQLHVYANELSAGPLAEPGPRTFPSGSVIVKEKLERLPSGEVEFAGLGLMRKDGEAWAYAYFEQEQLFEDLPELAYCAECHETGKVPEGLADIFGLGDVSELRLGSPRDSVFLTLPAPPP